MGRGRKKSYGTLMSQQIDAAQPPYNASEKENLFTVVLSLCKPAVWWDWCNTCI
jgi:hypothetical protein